MSKGRGKRMKGDERRAQLVDVARQVFAENGYAHTTTAKIALEAGVSEPILYKHFDSKLDFFHAIIRSTLEESRAFFEEVRGSGASGAEKILAIVADFPRLEERNRMGFQVIERALAAASDEKTRALLSEYYHGLVESVTALLEEGRKDGSIRTEVAPESLAWMFTMNGIGFCLLTGLEVPAIKDRSFPEEARRIVADMLGYRDEA